jgi:hypothetical protein
MAVDVQVSFGTIVHGGPPPSVSTQVSFGTIVHGGPPPSVSTQVSFGTLVHSGTDWGEAIVDQASLLVVSEGPAMVRIDQASMLAVWAESTLGSSTVDQLAIGVVSDPSTVAFIDQLAIGVVCDTFGSATVDQFAIGAVVDASTISLVDQFAIGAVWGDAPPGRPTLPQSTPSEYISDDYTVNTFAIDRLSSQYTRKTEQVPFSMCMRGPGSVRGRDKDSPYRPESGRRRRGRKKKRNQE